MHPSMAFVWICASKVLFVLNFFVSCSRINSMFQSISFERHYSTNSTAAPIPFSFSQLVISQAGQKKLPLRSLKADAVGVCAYRFAFVFVQHLLHEAEIGAYAFFTNINYAILSPAYDGGCTCLRGALHLTQVSAKVNFMFSRGKGV